MASTDQWLDFFEDAGIPSKVAVKYALTFSENRIKKDMLLDLNKEYLKEMGITPMGDIISILKHAKEVFEEDARTNVLKSQAGVSKKILTKKEISHISGDVEPKKITKIVHQKVISHAKKRPITLSSNYEQYSDEEDKPSMPKVIEKQTLPIRPATVAKRVMTKSIIKTSKVAAPQQSVQVKEDVDPPKVKVRRVLPEHEGPYKIIMPSGTTARTQKILSEKAISSTVGKMTVFDRLGDSSVSSTTGVSSSVGDEPRITITGLGSSLIRPKAKLASDKMNSSVFSRLGNKPLAADLVSSALSNVERKGKIHVSTIKLGGILKKNAAPGSTKKKVIKIVKKKVPIIGTMKSDLPSPGMQDRLGVTSTTSVAKVLPIKKTTVNLSKTHLMRPTVNSTATLRTITGQLLSTSGIKSRLGISSTSVISTTKKVAVVNRVPARTMSSIFSKPSPADSGNVFARLGR